jgi:putative Mg2+ transporter-C (MgtC) family protein
MHLSQFLSAEPEGQTLLQLSELGLALLLSAIIGLEREFKLKSAGLRTHALVGVASALILLISKYGFTDILAKYLIVLDPSRVAAQVISGIGFIGGGLIFVQRDVVRGLTTAATIWLTAAVGMACGAGLPLLAVAVTAAHFLVVLGGASITRRIHPEGVWLQVQYQPGTDACEAVMQLCTAQGFSIQELAMQQPGAEGTGRLMQLYLLGRGGVETLLVRVGRIAGVLSARAAQAAPSRLDSGAA